MKVQGDQTRPTLIYTERFIPIGIGVCITLLCQKHRKPVIFPPSIHHLIRLVPNSVQHRIE